MKQFSDVIEINEAMLNSDMLTFIPCQATKGEVKFCVAVGGIFNIKKKNGNDPISQTDHRRTGHRDLSRNEKKPGGERNGGRHPQHQRNESPRSAALSP